MNSIGREELSGGTCRIFTFGPEVWQHDDREEIFAKVIDELTKAGLHKEGLVFTGFDGSRFHEHSSFGARNGSWGMTEPTIRQNLGTDKHATPLEYLEGAYGGQPVLAVFDGNRLLGGDVADIRYLRPMTKTDLNNTEGPTYFATPDGSSLDTVTVAVFLFG